MDHSTWNSWSVETSRFESLNILFLPFLPLLVLGKIWDRDRERESNFPRTEEKHQRGSGGTHGPLGDAIRGKLKYNVSPGM
jgi:hypothetical protein